MPEYELYRKAINHNELIILRQNYPENQQLWCCLHLRTTPNPNTVKLINFVLERFGENPQLETTLLH